MCFYFSLEEKKNYFFSTLSSPLRNPRELSNEGKHTVTYGLQSISYRAPLLWSLLPQPLKNIDNLATFKREIKRWQRR